MSTPSLTIPGLLRLRPLREVLSSPGPCVTMLLPPNRPGEPAGSPVAVLTSNIRETSKKLATLLPAESVSRLLDPLHPMIEDPEFAAGSHWGRVIFRSPSVLEQFHLIQPVKASFTVAGSFLVRPLMAELTRPDVFYILNLSKTKVAVLRCTGLSVEPVNLPRGVPSTLADALDLEPPDHDLENRSSIGSSTGGMHSVRFGTGNERETKHAHLADFYRLVSRGVEELVGGPDSPLILAGVDEETAQFRAVSRYAGLIKESIPGSTGVARPYDELLHKAHSILQADTERRQTAALLSAKERFAPARFSTDPSHLLQAAFAGRLEQLYVNRDAHRSDVFERGTYHSWGQEDVLNLAAVQTMLHHGEACELPAEAMPEGAPAAGIMRY